MVHDEDESAEGSERKSRKPAREKVMDFLARRGHSELELRRKLARHYEEDEVDDALAFARENGWMTSPEELSERVSEELARKKKGHRYVNRFLKSKGLPPVAKDQERELESGRKLAAAKLGHEGPFTYEEKGKIYRLLANRGFDDETIRRVLDD